MMQLTRKKFAAVIVLALLVGGGAGAFATGRAADIVRGRTPAPSFVEAPILPVQMPLTTGTFAKVAEAIKPAVVNINTVTKGGAGLPGGRTPFEEFFGEEFFRRFFGDAP